MHVNVHWLDEPERVKFKLVSMVHDCLHHKAPRTQWTTAFQTLMQPVYVIFVTSGVITWLCLEPVYRRREFAVGPTANGTH